MAQYDQFELLERLKFYLMRPEIDEAYTDAQLYMLLSDAQVQVYNEVATHFPRVLMRAPTLLTTADGGLTYTISALDQDGVAEYPMGHAEVYARIGSNSYGSELYASTFGEGEGDVVMEGGVIRLPNAIGKTFDDGPYIRYVPMPGTISAVRSPTLQPKHARILIVYRALVLAHSRGGLRGVEWAEELYRKAWAGDPKIGEVGFQGVFATQYARQWASATSALQWWRTWRLTLGSPMARNT